MSSVIFDFLSTNPVLAISKEHGLGWGGKYTKNHAWFYLTSLKLNETISVSCVRSQLILWCKRVWTRTSTVTQVSSTMITRTTPNSTVSLGEWCVCVCVTTMKLCHLNSLFAFLRVGNVSQLNRSIWRKNRFYQCEKSKAAFTVKHPGHPFAFVPAEVGTNTLTVSREENILQKQEIFITFGFPDFTAGLAKSLLRNAIPLGVTQQNLSGIHQKKFGCFYHYPSFRAGQTCAGRVGNMLYSFLRGNTHVHVRRCVLILLRCLHTTTREMRRQGHSVVEDCLSR